MKLSNASQPTCTSTVGDVHYVYIFVTCRDVGTLLSPLNIAIVCVGVGVCNVFVFVWYCDCASVLFLFSAFVRK